MLIRPEEMKTLIKSLPVIKAAHDSIKSELERLVENIDDSIYAACMNGLGSGGGIPPNGSVSDKTGKIALKIQYSTRSDIKQLQKDVNLLSNVIESLNAGMKVLTKIQKAILKLRYSEDGSETPWKDVTMELKKEEIFFSVSHVKRIHDFSIKRMISAAQITVDTYQEVMEIMDGRGG